MGVDPDHDELFIINETDFRVRRTEPQFPIRLVPLEPRLGLGALVSLAGSASSAGPLRFHDLFAIAGDSSSGIAGVDH
jgi:hypothetical protein